MSNIADVIKKHKVIGRRRYENLKFKLSLIDQSDVDALVMFRKDNNISVAQAEIEIEKYEEKNKPFSNEKTIEYFKKVKAVKVIKQTTLTKDMLWKMFAKAFYEVNGKVFIQTKETIENIKPLIYYFIRDLENFIKCDNVSKLSVPNFNKGLLIVGGTGTGKTSIMKSFEKAFESTNLRFKGYTTNDVITEYERFSEMKGHQLSKDELIKSITTGRRYFDDIKTERRVKYMSTELFKEVFEIRNEKKLKTFLTMNYSDESPNNLDVALLEMHTKYGKRVYDRIFEDYIIIEFKGKSFRK